MRGMWRWIKPGLLACVSVVSLMLTFRSNGYDHALTPDGAVWLLAVPALVWLYARVYGERRRREQAALWVLSLFFALWQLLGTSFALYGDPRLLTLNTSMLMLSLLYIVGRTLLYYACMTFLRERMAALPEDSPALHGWKGVALYAGLLLLCWLAYAVLLYPGCVTRDAISQMAQSLGKEPLSAAHPVVQTWLLAIPLWLTRVTGSANAATALCCYGQMLLLALLLGYSLALLRGMGVSRKLTLGALALYALMPVFATYGMTLCKDVPFGMAILLLVIALCRLVRLAPGKKPPRGLWAQLLAASLLTTLLRNAGFWAAAVTLAIVLIWLLRTRRKARLLAVCSLALSVAAYVGLGWASDALGYAPAPDSEVYSIPLQQTARCLTVHRDELTEAEAATLNAVLDLDAVADAYNPLLSDPVKKLWKADASAEEKAAFFRLWLGFVKRWPNTCLIASYHNTYGYLYPGYVTTLKKPRFSVVALTEMSQLRPEYSPVLSEHAQAVDSALETALENPLCKLLMAPGLYGWLLLFAVALCVGRTRRRYLLPMLPLLLTLFGLFGSAVNAYIRYAMPIYYGAPFALLLAAHAQRGEAEPSAAEALRRAKAEP